MRHKKSRPLTTEPTLYGRGFAPAKVNLTLHVTGQRPDGYHLLDSLVVFASIGDQLEMRASDTLSLRVAGPQSDGVPCDDRNSILKAARAYLPEGISAAFTLDKRLPTAAGIGSGTADAAAALRLIFETWPDGPVRELFDQSRPLDARMLSAADLGADVPVSLYSKTARMRGIGERVEFLPSLPRLHAILVNPRVEVSTPAIFKSMASKNNSAMDPLEGDFLDWLSHQRNDMQDAAIAHAPAINDVLTALSDSQLARMSGSGATCFGIYPDAQSAKKAATRIIEGQPTWWVEPCTFG